MKRLACILIAIMFPLVCSGDGWHVQRGSGGAVTASCNSCSSGTSLTYTLSRTIDQNETGTYSWDVAANGVEDAAGNDLVDISGAAITNDSEQDTTPPTRGLNNMSSQNVNWH